MNRRNPHPPVVMVVGGMDPSGGAGLCADIQTLSAMGCHAAPVITAITVQDTSAVKCYQLVEAEMIRSQMQSVLDDMTVSVVKTGMLGSREIVAAVSEVLSQRTDIQLIIDPVFSSNNNEALSEYLLSESISELLLPLASLICPNIPEAAVLARKDITATIDADECAALICSSDAKCECLITGTHAESSLVVNRYYRQGRKIKEWEWQRLEFDYHGSGCTLASAIAAGIAQGLQMEQALDKAQLFVIDSLLTGFKPGHGQHIPNRLFHDPGLNIKV